MNKEQNLNNADNQQLNIAGVMRSVLSEITDTCIYLREFQSKAKEDGNNDKVIAYETSISNFEEMAITLSGLVSELNESKIIKQQKLWNKLKKELKQLEDENYKARIIFDYVVKHYA